MQDIHAATKVLRSHMSKCSAASAHVLWAVSKEGDEIMRRHFFRAHFRGSNPRIALLAACNFDRGEWVLRASVMDEQDFEWYIDITVVGRFFVQLQSSDFLLVLLRAGAGRHLPFAARGRDEDIPGVV